MQDSTVQHKEPVIIQRNITYRTIQCLEWAKGSYKPAPGLPQCRKLINTYRTQQTHAYFNIG